MQWVLTWTQVCVPAPKAPWSSHGGSLRQPLELHLSFQPHVGPAPRQGFLLHSEGWVTWQVSPPLQPPEAPRQPASFAPQPCGWIFHGGKMGICWAQLGFRGHLGAALCCHTHTRLHAHTQPHMDISRLPASGNRCPLHAWLALKMLSGGGYGGLRCQASSLQAQLLRLMTCLPPLSLCDLSPTVIPR